MRQHDTRNLRGGRPETVELCGGANGSGAWELGYICTVCLPWDTIPSTLESLSIRNIVGDDPLWGNKETLS